MSPSTAGLTCPHCRSPLDKATNFCGNCGAQISGAWGPDGAQVTESADPHREATVDKLAHLLTEATLGEYDIYGELGRGGMAAVYLALDLALNRLVAIKTMLSELVGRGDMVERFRREAQTAAALSHPHIIQIYAVKQTPNLVYFVMKLIEGRSLESVILEKGRLSVEMTQVILGQVAGALAYAHKKHVVHRDIKPANIMLDENGWAIVTDFGIAKVQDAQNLTATGTAVGTPHYMSPEQFHNNKAITGASDQYSLGVVAYEMLLGQKPFGGTSFAEIITRHLFEPPKDVRQERPDVPESVAAAIMRMLAKEPADRFPDLDAAATALGMPQHVSSGEVRTQIISIAKDVTKKTRISVPISPIPTSKQVPAALDARSAPTVTVPPAVPVVGSAPSIPAKRRARRWIVVAASSVIGIASIAVWKWPNPTPPVQPSPKAAVETPVSPAPPPVIPQGNGRGGQPDTVVSPPRTARLNVEGLPSDGVVRVDGQRRTDRDITLKPGAHDIRLEAPGFEPMSRHVGAHAGETIDIAFTRKAVEPRKQTPPPPVRDTAVRPPPASASMALLRLLLTPPATVSIDGKAMGEQSRLQDSLVAGTHTLRFERTGWMTKDTVVTLGGGSTTTLRIQLTERQP